LGISFTVAPVTAQRDFSNVQIRTVPVSDGVYMLMGAGGNIGLSVGEDGPFVIDDQFAPLTEKILAAIAAVSDGSVRFVLNTHWHGDHVGGNENLGKAGALNWYRTLDPDEAASEGQRYGMARTLYLAGDYEEAQPMFQRRALGQPDSIGYHGYLGALAARTGDRDGALRMSEEISGMARPFLNGVTTFWRGRIAAVLGDAETAVAYLRQSEFEGRQLTGEEKIMVDLQDLRDYQPFLDWLAPKDGPGNR